MEQNNNEIEIEWREEKKTKQRHTEPRITDLIIIIIVWLDWIALAVSWICPFR